MTSLKEFPIVPCSSDMIEIENPDSSDNYEHETAAFRFGNKLIHSLDDDTNSSIVSDFTDEGSTKHVDSKFNKLFLL